MQLWGKTAAGSQRFRCAHCQTSSVRKRSDNLNRQRSKIFVSWVTDSNHLNGIKRRYGITRKTLIAWLKPFWHYLPLPRIPKRNVSILVVDATAVVKRECVALIALDTKTHQPISWSFAVRESYTSWKLLFVQLTEHGINPRFVVCDGQRGLLKAIGEVWPEAKIQRCLIHIVRQAKAWLTQNPKTVAGQELLALVKLLTNIRTRSQKKQWLQAYQYWSEQHQDFLKERSYNVLRTHWWYTHRRLRAVRSLLSNSIPELFTFISYPQVPRTSNHVEGGINSRLKDLYRIHRGLSPWKKIVLTAWYLKKRQEEKLKKKPTRKVT